MKSIVASTARTQVMKNTEPNAIAITQAIRIVPSYNKKNFGYREEQNIQKTYKEDDSLS